MDHEQQLTAALADGTRYRIYRSIMERPGTEVTVAEIADEFSLHPNVARMHLSKLEQAGLLVTSLRKGAGGGRPAKLYRLSERVSTIQFPPRHYETLADLALTVLGETGDIDEVRRVCHDRGREAGETYVAAQGAPPADDLDAVAAVVGTVAQDVGMVPLVEVDGGDLVIDVRNCVYRELSTARPTLVCAMHRSFIEGFVEAVSGHDELPHLQVASAISEGDDLCHLRITID